MKIKIEDIPINSGIYKFICTTNNKIYIGSAKNLRKRFIKHLSLLKLNQHSSVHFQNCYNKYTIDEIEFEILELCEIEKLLIREQFYLDSILHANLNDNYFIKNGMNILRIAGSRLGSKQTKKSIKKSVENNPNRKEILYYDFSGNLIKEFFSSYEASRDLKLSASSILKNANKEINYTKIGLFIFKNEKEENDEYLKSLKVNPIIPQIWNKGKKTNIAAKNAKKLLMYDIYGQYIKTFSSQKEAAIYLNVNVTNLNRTVNKNPIFNKYWCFLENFDSSEIINQCKKYKDLITQFNEGFKFTVFDLYGNKLNSWNNVKDCALALQLNESGIRSVLNNERNTYKNLIFRYNNDIV